MGQKERKPPLVFAKADLDRMHLRGYDFDPSPEKQLGAGSFGAVFPATANYGQTSCAVKVIDIVGSSQACLPMEVHMMRRLSHPHIITTYDLYLCSSQEPDTPNRLLIFMELASGGELTDLLRKRRDKGPPLTEQEAAGLYVQVADAVRYIHSIGYAHRDIKPANVLLDKDGACKLSDFGLGSIVYDPAAPGKDRTFMSWAGTLGFTGPEIMRSWSARYLGIRYCAQKADVWAMGVMLYQMLNERKYPYPDPEGEDDKKEYRRICRDMFRRQYIYHRVDLSWEAMRAVDAHLEPDPDRRASMAALLGNEPWLVAAAAARANKSRKG